MQKIFGRAGQPLLPQKVLSVAIVTVAFCICAAAFPAAVAASAEEGDRQPAEVFTHKVEKKLLPLPDCKDLFLIPGVEITSATPCFLARSKILLPGFMPEMLIKMQHFAVGVIL